MPSHYFEDEFEILGPTEGDPVHSPGALRHRANATLLMLARNSDVDGAVRSVREVEDRFNRKHRYPWVFLNEQSFSDDFIRCACALTPLLFSSPFSRLRQATTGECPSLLRGQFISVRFRTNTGISQAGSMRQRRRRRDRRWNRRVSYTGVASRMFVFLLCTQLVLTLCLQIPKHVPFQLWGNSFSFLDRFDLSHVYSSSFATRCSKTSGTTGVSSESCLGFCHAFLLPLRPLTGQTYTSTAT
jgi:Glycolipid 2-alpha-mannosyltransferase